MYLFVDGHNLFICRLMCLLIQAWSTGWHSTDMPVMCKGGNNQVWVNNLTRTLVVQPGLSHFLSMPSQMINHGSSFFEFIKNANFCNKNKLHGLSAIRFIYCFIRNKLVKPKIRAILPYIFLFFIRQTTNVKRNPLFSFSIFFCYIRSSSNACFNSLCGFF
jgi:hypothetical protein